MKDLDLAILQKEQFWMIKNLIFCTKMKKIVTLWIKLTLNKFKLIKLCLGEKRKLLKENMEVNVQFYDEQALSVELPPSIELKIETTDAAIKGQTASSSYKPATLENGIKIMVPPFISSDDKIVLDTRTLEYIKKIK